MKTYNALQFINFVQEDCLLHGVQLILHPSDKIELAENFNVSGYWSEEDRTLNVATHHDEWLTTLAHEYGHFCQWKDGKFSDQKTFNAYVNYDEWIVGEKELSREELDAACKQIQKCELDCEKRATKLIKKFKLSNNVQEYIQKSNSYVLGYEASKRIRKWFKVSPSRIKELNKLMPTTFVKDLKPTKKQLNLMLKSCF